MAESAPATLDLRSRLAGTKLIVAEPMSTTPRASMRETTPIRHDHQTVWDKVEQSTTTNTIIIGGIVKLLKSYYKSSIVLLITSNGTAFQIDGAYAQQVQPVMSNITGEGQKSSSRINAMRGSMLSDRTQLQKTPCSTPNSMHLSIHPQLQRRSMTPVVHKFH